MQRPCAYGKTPVKQTFTGVDEIAVFYNYNNADQAKLIEDGTKELRDYQQGGGADFRCDYACVSFISSFIFCNKNVRKKTSIATICI